jgi:nucleoside-diphosphate-sugar epimerase
MVSYLKNRGFEIETPHRGTTDLRGRHLGHVIYAIGLTGNWRTCPQAAIEAHVNVLQRLMEDADFESWLYLSSTRIYGTWAGDSPAVEDAVLRVRPDFDALFDLSKLLGESVCMGNDRATIRVARLSNVYGPRQSVHTFLGSIIDDLLRHGKVIIGESPDSSKDYVSVDDVVEMLASISTQGRRRLYNVASGHAVTHQTLANIIRRCGYEVEFCANGPRRAFPTIDTARLFAEFGGNPRSILEDLPLLIEGANQTA